MAGVASAGSTLAARVASAGTFAMATKDCSAAAPASSAAATCSTMGTGSAPAGAPLEATAVTASFACSGE
eukprot:1147321-Heterocapsa_arctica.AAC.1